MKKLSLSHIAKEELNKKELHKIRGGAEDCDCTGPIYPSLDTKKNGGLPIICYCDATTPRADVDTVT